MIIDLTKLLNSYVEEITFEDVVAFDESYLKNTEIRELNNVYVTGIINKTMDDMYSLSMNITGEMIVPCSVSLEDVKIKLDIEVNEVLTDNEEFIDEGIKITNKTIDIYPIIWENILMEIPIKVISENLDRTSFSGDGWKLMTEEDLKSNKEAE